MQIRERIRTVWSGDWRWLGAPHAGGAARTDDPSLYPKPLRSSLSPDGGIHRDDAENVSTSSGFVPLQCALHTSIVPRTRGAAPGRMRTPLPPLPKERQSPRMFL